MKDKIQLALAFLSEGKSILIDDFRLEIDSSNTLTVTGWSQFLNFANLSKHSCLRELEEIKSIFLRMIDSSAEFEKFMVGKEVEYILCYDDAGKLSIDICSEKNGIIEWRIELK
jgi:hypothetical protein